jgi:hypothetical protein
LSGPFSSFNCLIVIVFRHRYVLLLTEQYLILLLLFSKSDSLFALSVYLILFNLQSTLFLLSTLSIYRYTAHFLETLNDLCKALERTFLTGQDHLTNNRPTPNLDPNLTMRFNTNTGIAALAVLLSSHTAQAHTWMESIRRIGSDGTFVGPVGYQRGFIARGPGFSDDALVYRLTGQSVPDSAPMCKDSQKAGMQGSYAKLQAAPKDFVALQYLENGHVTKNTGPRPFGNGTVYVYGTKTPSDSFKFNAIHKKWNAAGTGGDKKGVLLATRFYDDGQCFQVNSASDISRARMASSGLKTEVPCQTDVQLPKDAGTSGDYTLYWVWDYALMTEGTGKQATAEFYTACMDIAMTTSPPLSGGPAAAAADPKGLLSKAIPEQLKTPFLADPTAEISTTPQSFKAPANGSAAPAVPVGGNSGGNGGGNHETQPAVGVTPTPGAGGQGLGTVTVTKAPVATVTVTRDPASSAQSSGAVFVSDRPSAGVPPTSTAPPSTMVTSVQPSAQPIGPPGVQTSAQPSGPPAAGRPSVRPFTKNAASSIAARSEATPAVRFARGFRRWNA